VKVGDRLVVTYLEALSLTLKKEGKELLSSKTKTDGVRAAPGAKPGGAVASRSRSSPTSPPSIARRTWSP
jgi:hypothetical protein